MKKNQNNKGFTLVELIIVIAVLAILMVALVPQYIKYVERAHESNDVTVAESIENALEIALVDPQNDVATGQDFTVTWATTSNSGAITVVAKTTSDADEVAVATKLQTEIIDIVGSPTAAESEAGAGTDYVITVTDGEITLIEWDSELGDY